MVRDEVQNESDPQTFTFGSQFVKILHRSILWRNKFEQKSY